MGATRDEIRRFGEARDHQRGRALAPASPAGPGEARHSPRDLYRWYDLYQIGGSDALEDRPSRPGRVWDRIPDEVRDRVLQTALDHPERLPRELAVRFTDTARYFVSEASV